MAMNKFKVEKVLNEDSRLKFAAVSGRVVDGSGDVGSLAVAVLNKEGFEVSKLQSLFEAGVEWVPFMDNDVYQGFTIKNAPVDQCTIRATFIHPATDKHVAKYTRQEIFACLETPEVYKKVVKPFLANSKFSLQWVYNILEGKSEAERICFRDEDPEKGFIMAPDLKWSGENQDELYCLAIVNRRDLGSLRDLRAEHIPLLENLLASGTRVIKEKYGVPASKLKIFVHYHPSYYHFHVHFIHLHVEGFGSGIEKGHLLQSVISNLKIDPLYYTKADLMMVLRNEDPLKKLVEDFGALAC